MNSCVVLLVAVIGAVTSASINSYYNNILQKSNSQLTGITGGTNASIKEFNFLATVRIDGEPADYYSTGIILNKEWILISSMFSYGAPANLLKVRVGSEDALTGGKEFSVSAHIWHPASSNDITEYSIALLKLSESLDFSESVGSVKFAASLPENGASSVEAGFGGEDSTTRLSKLDVSFLDNESCKKIDPKLMYSNICAASTSNSGANLSDWGSPLLHNGELIGSISSNVNNSIGIYMDLTQKGFLKKWIDQIIR